ncbi:MAG: hypothetical protein ACOC22_02580 [bacterium]
MSSKQVGQSLVHRNCEIPYIIGDNYRYLVDNSISGIFLAPDSGKVIFRDTELIILYYDNLQKVVTKHVPFIKQTTGIFASSLRFCLDQDDRFEKGQIIYSYDDFREGIPSYGYNTFTGYFSFFGLNHEDAIVVSEDFAEKAKSQFTETVCIPIFEYTLLQPIHREKNSFSEYFPFINQELEDDIVCSQLQPRTGKGVHSTKDLKNKTMLLLNSMNVSDLLNLYGDSLTNFSIEQYKSKITGGKITGIKVHRNKKDAKLVDTNLQNDLEKLYKLYIKNYVSGSFNTISEKLNHDYAEQIARTYFLNVGDFSSTNRKDLKQASYILEFEITKEEECNVGDKICNRYAAKGVISCILPSELRPITVQTKNPIDCIYNTFGVYSRMNISQILEGMVSKNIHDIDKKIKNEDCNVISEIEWLNNNIIKEFNDEQYYTDVNSIIKRLKSDKLFKQKFIENIKENNLFIEAPCFGEINTKNIYKNSRIPINEEVLIKKETIKYLKQKLKVNVNFPTQDIKIQNIFCAPIYTMRLYKLVSEIISARDLGGTKAVTKQPLRGRSQGGGSRLGQMEIEGLISHGAENCLKELITVKSDCEDEKKKLIEEIIRSGKYELKETGLTNKGGTKKVVSTLIKFLQE